MKSITLLCCCERSERLRPEAVFPWREALEAAGAAFIEVDDLCTLAEQGGLNRLFDGVDRIHVIACCERVVRTVLEQGGVEGLAGRLSCSSVEGEMPDDRVSDRLTPGGREELNAPEGPPPWGPVIDYACCTGCGRCLSFCLFGVYARDAAGAVKVVKKQNCKDRCPACARVCKERAILFPRSEEAEINGSLSGAERGEEPGVNETAAPAAADIYAALAARRMKSRTPLLSPDVLRQAEEERRACSEESQRMNME